MAGKVKKEQELPAVRARDGGLPRGRQEREWEEIGAPPPALVGPCCSLVIFVTSLVCAATMAHRVVERSAPCFVNRVVAKCLCTPFPFESGIVYA
jgi:hypothetical protein